MSVRPSRHCHQRYLVNVAQNGLLDALVLDDFTQDAAITAADDEHPFGVWVRVHGEVGDHLLVADRVVSSRWGGRVGVRTQTRRARCTG